jgi:cyanate lyase
LKSGTGVSPVSFVPPDPLVYRFYELVNVYGITLKELIHEEFGGGIMSAIDFKMDIGTRTKSGWRPLATESESL